MLYGIDISSWQEGIDIRAISKQCHFLIAKCTDGTYFKDEPFEQYMSAAKENEMLLGMYHYAENQSAAKQAEYFYNNSKAWLGLALPVLDLEESSIENWESFAREFCSTYKQLSGVQPIIYISNGYTERFSKEFAKQYKLWVAEYWYSDTKNFQRLHYADWPICSPWNDALLWQFSSSGRLIGFNGNLDLDYFDGTKEDWLNLCGDDYMAITDEDIDRIAKRCAEYVYGDKDKNKNLNMYNAVHWAYNNTVSIMDMLKNLTEKK